MAISLIGILVLLMLLGVAVAVLSLIVSAIQQRRYGMMALLGGLSALALLLMISALGFVSYQRAASVSATQMAQEQVWVRQQMANASHAAAHTAQQFHVSVDSHIPSWFVYSKLLLFVGFAVALAFFVFRRMTTPAAECGPRRRWPAFLAIPLVVLLWFGVR